MNSELYVECPACEAPSELPTKPGPLNCGECGETLFHVSGSGTSVLPPLPPNVFQSNVLSNHAVILETLAKMLPADEDSRSAERLRKFIGSNLSVAGRLLYASGEAFEKADAERIVEDMIGNPPAEED